MALDKNAVIKDAQKFAGKGQFDKAIAEWKKLIREYPNDANIFNTIGDLSLKKNAKADAVEAYKKAADLLASDGFTSKAIALYKKILNIDAKRVDVHIALGDLNAEKGLTGNALENYKQAADHYVAKGDMAKALGIYQKMADLNPTNAAFRMKLADMYAKQGLKTDAAKTYLEAADVHIENNALQEARQIFEKVLALDPQNKTVYHKAGVVYFKEEKYVEACKALKPAFEADQNNQELASLYLDALTRANKSAEVQEAIGKLLAAEPDRLDLHERLYRLHLANKEEAKALDEAGKIVEIHVNNRDFDEAEKVLASFISANPQSAAARRKRGEFFSNIRREEEGAKEYIAAADLFIAAGDRETAKDVLAQASELAPQLTEARAKLEALERGVAPAASGAPVPEAVPVEASPPEAEPLTFTPPEEATPSFAGAVSFGEAVETAVQPPAGEEDPAVTEAFTEIEVLIKYGLAAKALEQLETLAAAHASSPAVRLKLRDLYQEQGNVAKAVEHSLGLADVYARRGQDDQAAAVLREALSFAPGNAELMARLGAGGEVAAPPADFGTAAQEAAFGEISLEEAGPGAATPTLEQELLAGEEAPAFGEISFAPQPAAQEETLEGSLAADESPAIEWTPPKAEPAVPAGAGAFAQEIAPATDEPLAASVDISEVWAEAEFFFQQGLYAEARTQYERILRLSPSDARALSRIAEIERSSEEEKELSRLADAVEGLEAFVPAETTGAGQSVSASDEEAVRSLMKEIERMKAAESAPTAPATRPTTAKPAPESEEALFSFTGAAPAGADTEHPADETAEAGGDFFDLAAELREELGSTPLPGKASAAAEEQSLDDIFEEFKRGIEVKQSQEDGDSHYNLGIAYKEMGLLDDAIAEFQLTHEGEPMFVQSRYMLGLCFMEKEDFPKAIAEVRNALSYAESLSADAGDILSMQYDLGLAHQGAGNIGEATRQFQAVHDADPAYRDVAAKLSELSGGETISLDQLREDIEREISAKFLEEGERIGREEQTRKSERVKG